MSADIGPKHAESDNTLRRASPAPADGLYEAPIILYTCTFLILCPYIYLYIFRIAREIYRSRIDAAANNSLKYVSFPESTRDVYDTSCT